MAKSAKRDSAYYRQRLSDEHPAIYKDLVDGKYASVRQATIAAGLQKDRSPLQVMKSEWGKATNAEKINFLKWFLGAIKKTSVATASMPLLNKDRKLLPAAAARIEHIRKALGLEAGALMVGMGFGVHDQSLANALRNAHKIRPELELALEKLIADHAHL